MKNDKVDLQFSQIQTLTHALQSVWTSKCLTFVFVMWWKIKKKRFLLCCVTFHTVEKWKHDVFFSSVLSMSLKGLDSKQIKFVFHRDSPSFPHLHKNVYVYVCWSVSGYMIRDRIFSKQTNNNIFNINVIKMRGVLSTLRQTCSRDYRERHLRSKIRWFTEFCNSHYVSQLAAFFIDARAKRSAVKSCHIIFVFSRRFRSFE